MKIYLICVLLLICGFNVNAQSVTVKDLISLISMDYESSKTYLTQSKGFNALPVLDAKGTSIEQFNKHDNPGVTELIVKSQWVDDQRVVHKYIHYDVRPQSYALTIIEQLKTDSFSLKSKKADKNKSVWLFENQKYTISIYTFSEAKFPAAIEIHVK